MYILIKPQLIHYKQSKKPAPQELIGSDCYVKNRFLPIPLSQLLTLKWRLTIFTLPV